MLLYWQIYRECGKSGLSTYCRYYLAVQYRIVMRRLLLNIVILLQCWQIYSWLYWPCTIPPQREHPLFIYCDWQDLFFKSKFFHYLDPYTSIWLKHRQPWASSSKGVLLMVVKGKGWSLIATWTNNHKQSHRFRGPMSTGICYRIVKWCDFAVAIQCNAMGRGYIYTKTDAKYKSELYSIRSLYHFMYDRFSICTWCIDYQ